MPTRDLQDILRMLIEADQFDQPDARDRRSETCISMGRLATIARRLSQPTPAERSHLQQCGLCRARSRAMHNSYARQTTPAQVPHRPRRSIGWRTAISAVAACLLALVYPLVDHPAHAPHPAAPAHDPAAAYAAVVPINVCHEDPDDAVNSLCQTRFRTTTDVACIVAAVYRACDESCECRTWEIHQWDAHGSAYARLLPEQTLDIALDLQNSSAIGQLLVLAAPIGNELSSITPDNAERLLACLNGVQPAECEDGDISRYAFAVQECFPADVTVVEETFFCR